MSSSSDEGGKMSVEEHALIQALGISLVNPPPGDAKDEQDHEARPGTNRRLSNDSGVSRGDSHGAPSPEEEHIVAEIMQQKSGRDLPDSPERASKQPDGDPSKKKGFDQVGYDAEDEAPRSLSISREDNGPSSAFVLEDQNLGGFDSERALSDDGDEVGGEKPVELNLSSAQSLSTATQTHEVRMPMYLPTFKPATGCTNASDFIVRCFVARLRSGITVVKHGRSRWCKSRLRILHIHPDGRSLSWKPAQGEPNSSKRPPKLDLSTCLEVRHAWSPDPQNPMYTGTPILRQKCEAANAHKSFALIFPKRTVDITAVTADQCKVLMEGFSALCFRLQVANLAGRGSKKGTGMPDEEEVATTASVTLTNNSTAVSPPASAKVSSKR